MLSYETYLSVANIMQLGQYSRTVGLQAFERPFYSSKEPPLEDAAVLMLVRFRDRIQRDKEEVL